MAIPKLFIFPLLPISIVSVSACSTRTDLYSAASDWVRQSPIVTEYTGEITDVEPVGEIEESCAFTDGCSYRFTMQVTGENGSGTIRFLNAFIDRLPPQDFYLSSALWRWQGEEVTIHGPSGMRYEDYISLPNQLEVLSEEIARGNEDQRDYYRRAIVNWLLENRTEAYADIQAAIALEPNSEHINERINPQLYEPFREASRTLAVFQALDGKYDEAMKVVEELIASHDDTTPELVRDYLLRWFIQIEAGQLETANQVLATACSLSDDDLPNSSLSEEDRAAKILELIEEEHRCGVRVYLGNVYSGYLLYTKGQLAEAEEEITKQIELNDSTPRDYDSESVLIRGILTKLSE